MADLTVRQLAKELGVSKQAIHKRINQLPPKLTPEKVDGAYKLSPKIVVTIKEMMNESSTDNQHGNGAVDEVDREVDALQMMIKELKEEKNKLYSQLEKKDKQLSELHKLLDQQQQLTLQSNRQNERLQLQLEAFEKEEEAEEHYPYSSQNKKWWHFWS